MPTTIPALISPWRSGDRELVRQYLNWPASDANVQTITIAMNRVAGFSVETVTAVQGWIDQVETLEQDWADKVEDGTAHLGNVAAYTGPAPGVTLTRDDLLSQADVLTWDTKLLQMSYQSGTRADSTAGGVLYARVGRLKGQIVQALGLEVYGGSAMGLVRS